MQLYAPFKVYALQCLSQPPSNVTDGVTDLVNVKHDAC